MRRVLLFAAFLLLLGLTTATAASFDVQAEDIASFSQAVEIDVLDPPLTGVFYFVGGAGDEDIPGLLVPPDPDPPNASVRTKTILPSPLAMADGHDLDGTYHAWQTLPLLAPRSLGGTATVTVNFDGVADQFVAGIFHCSASLVGKPNTTVDSDVTGAACLLLGSGHSSGSSPGMKARSATFSLDDAALAVDDWMRLKIINDSQVEWRIQWGYNDAREAGLTLS